MPAFLINANDAIQMRHAYTELNTFARGYVEAMFFTNCDSGDDNEFRANELGVDALTESSVCAIAAYCEKFETANRASLASAYAGEYDEAQAGRDLWFTAQGHGCGYWDRSQLSGADADALTNAAKRAGEVYVTIGDDDRIYFDG